MVDLVALYQTLQSAADKDAEDDAYQTFLDEAKARLVPIFDDYENRRRSLGAIKARLAGALNHDEKTLRRLLFDMGAFEVTSTQRSGDQVLFELPVEAKTHTSEPVPPLGRKALPRRLLFVVFVLAALATIAGFVLQIFSDELAQLIRPTQPLICDPVKPPEVFEECIEKGGADPFLLQ